MPEGGRRVAPRAWASSYAGPSTGTPSWPSGRPTTRTRCAPPPRRHRAASGDLDDLARPGDVVAAERDDPLGDLRRAERVEKRPQAARLLARRRDLERLPGERDEVEPERRRRAAQAEAGVGLAGGDGERDVEVQLDGRPGDRVGLDARVEQEAVQQRARPGARRTAHDAQRAEVADAVDAARVAGRYEKTLLAPPEVDEHGIAA